MGSYGLRFHPARAPEGNVHPQRSALYQSGIAEKSFLLAAWEEILRIDFGSWVCGACAVRWGFACERARKPLPSRCAARVLAAARRGEVPLAGCSGGRRLCAAPRRVLRWRGARGALRPLFLLRSCAADQEKRPEKKSWALMACASIRPERLRETCIRSAPRCISRG